MKVTRHELPKLPPFYGAYAPGKRGLWLKVKCLYREEFVVVGWTDPEGRRPHLGALLLAYYDSDNRLVYAGRAGTGIKRRRAPTAVAVTIEERGQQAPAISTNLFQTSFKKSTDGMC